MYNKTLGPMLLPRPTAIDQTPRREPVRRDPVRREPLALSPAIVTGLEAVSAQYGVHGIHPAHFATLQAYAASENLVFAVRATTPGASANMLRGHQTKPLEVKGKTAPDGIARGFVCVDQAHSKLCGDTGRVQAANAAMAKLLGDPDGPVEARQLTLTRAQMAELESCGAITRGAEQDLVSPVRSRQGTGTLQFQAHRVGDEFAITHHGAPFMVLAQKHGARPELTDQLVADYDLLITAPHVEDFSPKHIARANSTNSGFEEAMKREREQRGAASAPAVLRRVSAPVAPLAGGDGGVRSAAEEKLAQHLNSALRVRPYQKLFHHGSDLNNPYTASHDSINAVFFLPRSMGKLACCTMVKSEAGRDEVLAAIKDEGYVFHGNAVWGGVRRGSFNVNAARFGATPEIDDTAERSPTKRRAATFNTKNRTW
ncbi:MAG: anthrax toxin-like adenylyl cyclase domain-containing protein [Pseudomonadota bacterium]